MSARCIRTLATLSSITSSVTDLSLKERTVAPAPSKPTGAAFAPVSPVDIEARAVSKNFADTPIFSDVSFRLARGEATALVGANGTGKSTLLRCLMGLIPTTDGSVHLLGQQVNAATGRQMRGLRAQVGLVSQKHNLVPRLSVLSNVVHGLLGKHPGLRHWSHSLAPQASRDAAMQALERVGLADYANRRADRLSGGQSQRVAIARAIVSAPKILFADEPCASLDPSAGEDVMELFFQLVRDEDVTVVFTSHNIAHALKYGDRVLGLAQGRIKLDATSASLDTADLRGLYD
ncbi:MAG: ATP-binding cassette domain-containing protein [Sulfitobacter sp.]|nr:ATP-binding cassette domain-containing protein [Sulfitobacter sp.]